MGQAFRAEVKGLKETQRNLETAARELTGSPIVEAVRDGSLMIERDAKRGLVAYESPTVGGVNTGVLRASITPVVNVSGEVVQGVVGSNKVYAPYVEFDTKPHWPPKGALALWAKRHHTVEFLVARAIARRGTFGKHFLENAFKANREKIKARIERAVQAIVVKANKP